MFLLMPDIRKANLFRRVFVEKIRQADHFICLEAYALGLLRTLWASAAR